ncbi:MAG TPA: DUF4870 domain-containing protein [Longimicrobium sp.]|nr:DUF4870 domain-containing protein [Longimicrobium sp.]
MSTPSTGSTTGLSDNVAGALAYVLGPITGIAFLVMEKESRFVRFHAMQSVLVGVVLIIVNFVMNVFNAVLVRIPLIGWLFALGLVMVVGLASLVLWLALMYAAYRGQEWELPVIGAEARKLLGDTGVAAQ